MPNENTNHDIVHKKYDKFLELQKTGITVGCTRREYQLLYDYALNSKGNVLELGGGDGASTEIIALALKGSDRTITQVDLKGDDSLLLVTDKSNVIKVERRTTDFFKLHDKNVKYSMIFIDADHTHAGALHDIRNSLDILESGGVLLAHDCCVPQTTHIADICRDQAEKYGKSFKLLTEDIGFGLGLIY